MQKHKKRKTCKKSNKIKNLLSRQLLVLRTCFISNRLKNYYVSPYIDTNSEVVLIMTVGTNNEVVRLVIFSDPDPP